MPSPCPISTLTLSVTALADREVELAIAVQIRRHHGGGLGGHGTERRPGEPHRSKPPWRDAGPRHEGRILHGRTRGFLLVQTLASQTSPRERASARRSPPVGLGALTTLAGDGADGLQAGVVRRRARDGIAGVAPRAGASESAGSARPRQATCAARHLEVPSPARRLQPAEGTNEVPSRIAQIFQLALRMIKIPLPRRRSRRPGGRPPSSPCRCSARGARAAARRPPRPPPPQRSRQSSCRRALPCGVQIALLRRRAVVAGCSVQLGSLAEDGYPETDAHAEAQRARAERDGRTHVGARRGRRGPPRPSAPWGRAAVGATAAVESESVRVTVLFSPLPMAIRCSRGSPRARIDSTRSPGSTGARRPRSALRSLHAVARDLPRPPAPPAATVMA